MQQDAFERAYMLATEEERAIAVGHFEKLSQLGLEQWTKNILKTHKEYEYLDIYVLRDIAQAAGVRGYAGFKQMQLVGILTQLQSKTKKEVLV